jgi:hypothetical protein
MSRSALALLALAALAGCGGPPSPPPAPPRPAAPPPETVADLDPLTAGPIGIFRSKRFDLVVPLPDGRGFAIDDTRGPWLVARHAGSRSTLLLRRWRTPGITTRDACERAARDGRPLPSLDAAELIEVKSVAVPPDHDTSATVALYRPPARDGAPPPPLFGMVLAFGAYARQCFAFAFVTEADGAGAEAIVAARLQRLVDQSLGGIQARSDLDPTLGREGGAGPGARSPQR